MTNSPTFVMRLYRLMRFFQTHQCPHLAQAVCYAIRILFGCIIPPTVVLKEGVRFGHALGIALHHEVVIGENTTIYQHVTIAGSGGGVPQIGRNCVIGTGAFLHGPIKIGDYAKIGANAVVLSDVPAYCTAVGVPAKIVKRGEPHE